MVSKTNNNQQNRAMQQQQQQNQRQNLRAAMAPYRKPFRGQGQGQNQNQGQTANQMMYTSCQMPSDPLYIDFNSPTPVKTATGAGARLGATEGVKKKPVKAKQHKGNKQQQQQQQQHQQQHQQQQSYNALYAALMRAGNGGMNMVDNNWQPQRFHNNNHFRNGFNRAQMGGGGAGGGGPPNRNGRHMMGPVPMGPRGPFHGGPMPPFPPMGFQPPMRCPMPPMGGPPPPPAFMRRNGRNHPPLPPPLMGALMMGPRMPPRGMPRPPVAGFNMGHMNGNLNAGKIKKPNPNLIKHALKGKSTIKTLKNLVNQYPIDKPWVNDDIRAIHDKKLDIENRLKGNKDDELFAQFKVQRDKFVSMYETAREAFLKQEAAAVMAKDANENIANTNQNADAIDVPVANENQNELVEQQPAKKQEAVNNQLNKNNNNSDNNSKQLTLH